MPSGLARFWVDISTSRGWVGTPHGLIRVEAGIAAAMSRAHPDSRALWVKGKRIVCGTHGDLASASDGNESRTPGFEQSAARILGPKSQSHPLTGLGRKRRIRLILELSISLLPRAVRDRASGALAAASPTSRRNRRARRPANWATDVRATDVVLTAGCDWEHGIVAAVGALPVAQRPAIWVLIHDLLPSSHRHLLCNDGASDRFEAWLLDVAAAADRVFFVSESSRLAFIAFTAERDVLAKGDLLVLTPAAGSLDTTESEPSLECPLTNPFVLYVSTIERRKNHQVLLEAVRSAETRSIAIPTVVLVGAWGWGVDDLRQEFEREGDLAGRVVHLEGITDAEVRWLLSRAEAVVFPSRFEGFGLPVMEARLVGKVILAADIPVLREVAGPSAQYIDPHDSGDWRDALAALAADAKGQPAVRMKAPPRSWDDVVAELLGYLVSGSAAGS